MASSRRTMARRMCSCINQPSHGRPSPIFGKASASAMRWRHLVARIGQFAPGPCDLSCQGSSHLSLGGVRPDKERSASPREDPIHLGAATRQCEGEIRRAKRRGQWAEAWEPQSGSALAEIGRLSASERPSKVRNRKTGPRGWWPEPKGQRVGSPDGTTDDGDSNSRRTKGRSRPDRTSPSGNRVSPTRPVVRRKPDRKGG